MVWKYHRDMPWQNIFWKVSKKFNNERKAWNYKAFWKKMKEHGTSLEQLNQEHQHCCTQLETALKIKESYLVRIINCQFKKRCEWRWEIRKIKTKERPKTNESHQLKTFPQLKKKKKNLGNTKRPFKKRKLKFLKCIIF